MIWRNGLIALSLSMYVSGFAQPALAIETPRIPCNVSKDDKPHKLHAEQYKSTLGVDIEVSTCRLFKTNGQIVRTSISDPAIAEPVVVCENEFYIIGKSEGPATVIVWNSLGELSIIEVQVKKHESSLDSSASRFKETLYRIVGGDALPKHTKELVGHTLQLQSVKTVDAPIEQEEKTAHRQTLFRRRLLRARGGNHQARVSLIRTKSRRCI